MEKEFKYDIAFSYAKENRDYVNQVAEHLSNKRIRLFYDVYEQIDIWGKDLYQHLHDVYSKQAKYTIIFISKHYAEKIWTNHELKSAQSRAIKENQEYILPVRFDSTELPGLSSNTAYLELSRISPVDLAELIIQKLHLPKEKLNHIGYSFILLRRGYETRRRHKFLFGLLFWEDEWRYDAPFDIYLDSQVVGELANGGELYIETTPGMHKIRAWADRTGYVDTGEGGGYDTYIEVDSGEQEIRVVEGKNILNFHYAEGHVMDNVKPVYFT